jgi:hypothetical protein
MKRTKVLKSNKNKCSRGFAHKFETEYKTRTHKVLICVYCKNHQYNVIN